MPMRIVTAPNKWTCQVCGQTIPAGDQCVKNGKETYCAKCTQQGVRNDKARSR